MEGKELYVGSAWFYLLKSSEAKKIEEKNMYSGCCLEQTNKMAKC